ncbi:AI-2E family transporter [Salinimicrobium soli]|uniref:AI-2E family transporter n=1 Tax=Salinimicrobium soli TaxID=1254399 RepID=UPI003AAD9F20
MASAKKILLYSTLSVIFVYFLIAGLIKAQPFLAPLTVAVILSLLVLPLNRKMESWKLGRTAASLSSTFLIFLLSLGFFALISMQVKNLVDDWPTIKETMTPKVVKLKEFVFEHTPLTQEDIDKTSSDGPVPFLSMGSNPGKKAMSFFNSVMSFFGNYLLTFIYIFFLVNYRSHFKKFLLRLFPDEKQDSVQNVITKSATVTQQYLFGRLILIGFLTIFYSIGLGLSGVNNFILVSVISAILSLIPYLGNIIGFSLAMIFGYLTSGDPYMLIGISLTFFIGQFIESYILTPYVVGDKVDLHPFLVILVVIIGNLLWGILGMLLAIPVIAIVNVVLLNIEPLRPFGYLLSKEDKEE